MLWAYNYTTTKIIKTECNVLIKISFILLYSISNSHLIQKENRSLLAGTSTKPSTKELFAYVFPVSRLERNATDTEIIADYNSEHEEDELTIKFTPDKFAAYCNDGFFNDQEQYIRFIQQ